MKTSWGRFFRRIATACMVTLAGSTAWFSAVNYAVGQAYDDPNDAAYADGWQAGDDGGTGFTAWNFDSGYIFAYTNYVYSPGGLKTIDDGAQSGGFGSDVDNNIGKAWAISLADDGDPNTAADGAPHIGRGLETPLRIGQTFSVTFDNPSNDEDFFKGYFIRLNRGSGGTNGNICNLGYGCSHPNFPDGYPAPGTELRIFENTPPTDSWQIVDDAGGVETGVTLFDTSAGGAVFSVTRTGLSAYSWSLDSLDGGSADGAGNGTFDNSGPIDWVEFVNFSGAPPQGFPAGDPRSFFISKMEVIGVPEPASLALMGIGIAALGFARRRREE